MKRSRSRSTFLVKTALVWVVMTIVLVVLPDTLERWMTLQFARAIGWAAACGVWVVVVEAEWKARFGPITRVALQFALWISAALVAIWISDAFRP